MDKLETTPADLSKLGDAVKIEVVKKTTYDELITLFRLLILVI